jgi:catechol 2,3-dioxygenase-like lactoylglutathione lyase family enzyme
VEKCMSVRMDNVLVVVDDLEAAIAFFGGIGLEVEGRAVVEGDAVDRLVGIDGVRSEIVVMRTPDGESRIELDRFHAPGSVRAETRQAPVNALGIRRLMFAVDDLREVLARLHDLGAELVGEVTEYAGYRMCYLRGPDGVMVALTEQLG